MFRKKYRPTATLFSRTRLSKEGEGGEWNARRRQLTRRNIQLHLSRETCSSGSPVATDPQDGGRDSEGDGAAVREVVLRRGASVDCAGAASAVAVVADLLFGAQ